MGHGEHVLHFDQVIHLPADEVFAFFAAAENLERITPPELRFRIKTPTPITIAADTLIDYELRLFGVPFSWKTRITKWDPPHSFIDEQLSGPYNVWVHTHSFATVAGGTHVRDEVRLRLPLYPLGEIAWPVVRLQVKRIFKYRSRQLDLLLPSR